jgi:hypothetical protein
MSFAESSSIEIDCRNDCLRLCGVVDSNLAVEEAIPGLLGGVMFVLLWRYAHCWEYHNSSRSREKVGAGGQ